MWPLSYTGFSREAFLFSSCLAEKEREEENSNYPRDVEIGRKSRYSFLHLSSCCSHQLPFAADLQAWGGKRMS